jgi:pyruvate kinase
LTRTEQIARTLALCWGVTAVVHPAGSPDEELSFAIEWSKSRRLVKPGEHVVLLRGQIPGQARSRAVLAREVT